MNGGPTATVGPYLVEKLRALDVRLRETATRALSSSDDADAVHDLRVALRRTRTLLEIGRPVFGPFHADEVRVALRDLQRKTGALRDEEVVDELVESLGVGGECLAAWLVSRRRHERRLRRALVRWLQGGNLDQGHRMIGALLAFRVNPERDKRLTKFARRAVAEAKRRVDRHRSARIDDPQALHRLRIGYKRLRYAIETFSDALPSDATALAQHAARLQGRLGALHDVDVAMGCVRRARILTDDARQDVLFALEHVRLERSRLYARESAPLAYAGVTSPQGPGAEALRKISTR
jgi:CHAD domain-containing protein